MQRQVAWCNGKRPFPRTLSSFRWNAPEESDFTWKNEISEPTWSKSIKWWGWWAKQREILKATAHCKVQRRWGIWEQEKCYLSQRCLKMGRVLKQFRRKHRQMTHLLSHSAFWVYASQGLPEIRWKEVEKTLCHNPQFALNSFIYPSLRA